MSREQINQLIAVFRRFSQFEGQARHDKPSPYENVVASRITEFSEAREPLSLLLPAFPWKNPNPEKTLTPASPDFGEELGLARLNHLCQELTGIYPHGVVLTLVADGPVYNDLLGITDSQFYDYGVQLRRLAQVKGFTHIQFRRLVDVLGLADGDKLSKAQYIALAETSRQEMESRFLPIDFDLEQRIREDRDTQLTYEKYIKSAHQDLRWGPDVKEEIKTDAERYTVETKEVAKRMTKRLLAYEAALESTFPKVIRLSIHRSTGKAKLSIPLIPQPNGYGLMPWHSTLLVSAQGEYLTGLARDLLQDRNRYEVITSNGKPWLVREKHPDFEWPDYVEISHGYGGKLLVKNKSCEEDKQKISHELKVKLANLAVKFGIVEVVGFQV